jgi:hypothetical protein
MRDVSLCAKLGGAILTLSDQRQRLNRALTELLASTVQVEVLVRSGIAIETSTFLSFYEQAAMCSGQIAALQEEITRLFQDQTEKGKQAQA